MTSLRAELSLELTGAAKVIDNGTIPVGADLSETALQKCQRDTGCQKNPFNEVYRRYHWY